jgi:predicted PurR-regulated permease PerM
MTSWLRRHRTPILLFVGYTVVFLLAAQAAVYVLPFVIAPVIAVVMKPLYDFLRRRFAFQSVFTATALTLIIFGIVLAIAAFLLYLIAVQALSLIGTYGYLWKDFWESPELFERMKDVLLSGDLPGIIGGVAEALFRVVPLCVTFVVITFALTVFCLHHLGEIRGFILSRLAGERRAQAARVMAAAYLLVRRFLRSYLILYLVTFAEAAFIFYLTGAAYPMAFAFIAAVADVLPVVGPGTVYLPIAIVFILEKNYITGVTLLIFFVFTVIVRQILEPRIVSDTVKVHPLIVLTAIYCSVAAMNILVLFYVLLLVMGYKVLSLSGVLKDGDEKPAG